MKSSHPHSLEYYHHLSTWRRFHPIELNIGSCKHSHWKQKSQSMPCRTWRVTNKLVIAHDSKFVHYLSFWEISAVGFTNIFALDAKCNSMIVLWEIWFPRKQTFYEEQWWLAIANLFCISFYYVMQTKALFRQCFTRYSNWVKFDRFLSCCFFPNLLENIIYVPSIKFRLIFTLWTH